MEESLPGVANLPTTLKVADIAAWVHTSHVKPADAPLPGNLHWVVQKMDNMLKLKISHLSIGQETL